MRAVTRAAPTQVVHLSLVDFGADVTVVLNASDCKAFIFQDGACYLKDQINHPRDCMTCLGVNFEEPVRCVCTWPLGRMSRRRRWTANTILTTVTTDTEETSLSAVPTSKASKTRTSAHSTATRILVSPSTFRFPAANSALRLQSALRLFGEGIIGIAGSRRSRLS